MAYRRRARRGRPLRRRRSFSRRRRGSAGKAKNPFRRRVGIRL